MTRSTLSRITGMGSCWRSKDRYPSKGTSGVGLYSGTLTSPPLRAKEIVSTTNPAMFKGSSCFSWKQLWLRSAVIGLLLCASICRAQQTEDMFQPFIQSRGPHQRTWSTTALEPSVGGEERLRTRTFTELSTGLCYQETESGPWLDSSPDFEITSDGFAVARRGQHQLAVAPSLNHPNGVLECVMPGGERLRPAILGLYLFSPTTGKSLMIGEVQPRAFEQTAPNEIVFSTRLTVF